VGRVSLGGPHPAARIDTEMMPRLIGQVTVAVTVLLLAMAGDTAPRPDAWQRWQAHDTTSWRRIDHAAWEQFLLRYVRIGPDGVHRVAYGEVTPGDLAVLEHYIAHLASLPVAEYNRDEQMAYWINLYNASLVRLVIERYPITDIREIQAGTGAGDLGPFGLDVVEIDGEALSLNDIRHHVLGANWGDPRVHYALSCGALGCPDLRPEPFTGRRLDEQLSDAAMDYINDPRCIQMEDERLAVSSIFFWYKEDFGGTDRAVINHLMAYAEPSLAMELQRVDRIFGYVFNWRLNDATG